MLSYLPSAHELAGAAGMAATLLLFLALGCAATPRRTLPEIQLLAGWGIACFAFTAWGVLTPWSLRWPAAGLGVTGVAWLLHPGWRERLRGWHGLGRILVLTIPLWLLMLSVWPSQIDTWLNLLPNAAYLFDYDRLPTAALPPSHSFLPVAPYNTQFADYLGSLAAGSFAEGGMSLFNVALLCAAALLIARALAATERAPPWWACAVALLLVAPLNPGFVPRFHLSSYGETPLAVTALFAVWLAAELLGELADGVTWPKSLVPLALVLVALVNTKQSGIGILVPVGVSIVVLAWADPAVTGRRAIRCIALAFLPSIALYLLWRVFALSSGFAEGELKPLPVAEWNELLLPQIVLAVFVAMFRKATFFLCVAALLVLSAAGAAPQAVVERGPPARYDRRCHRAVQRLFAVHLCRAFSGGMGARSALVFPLQHPGLTAADAGLRGRAAALGVALAHRTTVGCKQGCASRGGGSADVACRCGPFAALRSRYPTARAPPTG